MACILVLTEACIESIALHIPPSCETTIQVTPVAYGESMPVHLVPYDCVAFTVAIFASAASQISRSATFNYRDVPLQIRIAVTS